MPKSTYIYTYTHVYIYIYIYNICIHSIKLHGAFGRGRTKCLHGEGKGDAEGNQDGLSRPGRLGQA